MSEVAFLILCHRDPIHVSRLARRLASARHGFSVFIHVDLKSEMEEQLRNDLERISRVHFVDERVSVHWGGFTAVDATLRLLRLALDTGPFDRFVLLQGADYPIKSNDEIESSFELNKNVEFIRACNCSKSRKRHLHLRARQLLLYDGPNLLKSIANKMVRLLNLKLLNKHLTMGHDVWDIYWGCAQFAITRKCAEYIISYGDNAVLRRGFHVRFPADEMFFHTIVYNSHFSGVTQLGRAEPEYEGIDLVDLRNLTYFEYPDRVTVFGDDDLLKLRAKPELFARKFETGISSNLLNYLDEICE